MAGLAMSLQLDTPAGPSIVTAAAAIFAASVGGAGLWRLLTKSGENGQFVNQAYGKRMAVSGKTGGFGSIQGWRNVRCPAECNAFGGGWAVREGRGCRGAKNNTQNIIFVAFRLPG
jgi:hypothetical protein